MTRKLIPSTEAVCASQAPDPRDQVRRWTAGDISRLTCTTQRTLRRSIIPAMQAAGVIARLGRSWYGRQRDIEDFLLGRYERTDLHRVRSGR